MRTRLKSGHRMDKSILCFPESKEIASLEGLTLWCPEITSQYSHWHRDARFSWLEDIDIPLHSRHNLFLTYTYRDNPIFSF